MGKIVMPNRNVLLMMTDQQRFDTIAALGNSTIRTPNLDRLCARGVGFRNAYTPQPVCGPARHSLFTGADVATSGLDAKFGREPQKPGVRFMPEVLAEGGYRTGGFGKMHFSPLRAHHGFQHYAVREEQDRSAYREDDDYLVYLKEQGYGHIRYPGGVRGLLYFQPQISPIPEEHHETKWVADRAIEFLRTFHRAPFFCFASWMQPHWPVHVPETFAHMYDLPETEDPVYREGERVPYTSEQNRVASDLFDEGNASNVTRMKRSKALYYASVSFIDKQVGRILDTLEELGRIDDTLIIFTSDHGETLGDHRALGKVTAYEPVVGIPMIVAGPEMEGLGKPSDDLVTLYDIAPTVYEFTSVTPPPNVSAGASLLGSRPGVRNRDRVFFEIGEGRSGSAFVGVRTRRWKYAFYHAGPFRQLFDMENDPNELNNLCEGELTPEHRTIMEALHQSLLDWNAEHGLPGRVENGDFKPAERPAVPPDRNAQYDQWIDHLPADEKAQLWSEARSVFEAIRNEASVDPADLDLEFWQGKRGAESIAELESLVGRKLR